MSRTKWSSSTCSCARSIDENAVPSGLDAPRVVEVSNLLREVIAALDMPGLSASREQVLGALALDELTRSEPLPLSVPMPNEKRLRALCEAVIANPANSDSLEQWAASVGASTRTIARLFRQELGVSFSQWRQQALLARAIPLLSQGRPLAHVAQELGYQSQSAFSAMFRRAFGKSPRAFIERGSERREGEGHTETGGQDVPDGTQLQRTRRNSIAESAWLNRAAALCHGGGAAAPSRLNPARQMPDRAELREARPRELVTHAQIQPSRGIVDEHPQLEFTQAPLARPLM